MYWIKHGPKFGESMWIKYRHTFAWGIDKEWKYIEIPDNLKEYGYDEEDAIGEWLLNEEQVGRNHSYSDKYRGIEYFQIDNPPVDEIIRRLNNHRKALEHNQKSIDRFQKMLDDLGHVTKEDFDV